MSASWMGLIGVIVGSATTIGTLFVRHHLESSKANELDSKRKDLLKTMLKNAKGDGWMSIEILSQVVGAEPDTTRRLLLEIDARGSQKEKEVWSLISRNPLPTS